MSEEDCDDWIDDDPVTFEIDSIDKESAKAWLVTIGGAQHWLPKSQCKIRAGEVDMPAWLAAVKGI